MITTPISLDLVKGAAELETTARGALAHRLPTAVRERFADGQLLAMEAQPSGVRVELRTAASRIELDLHSSRLAYRSIARPRGRVDIVVDGALTASVVLDAGDAVETDLSTGQAVALPGPTQTIGVDLDGAEHLVEIWLPHNESVELIALRSDAAIAATPAARPLWVHHGSSISHGSNASSPTEIWPVVAARRAGVGLRNLGFGGSALVDPFMARVIRDSPADMISVKLGINVVNLDGMRRRTFVPAVHGFIDTIRDGHPDTPLLLVSPIFAGIHEQTPGPGAFDPDALRAGEVRFVATGDPEGVARGQLTLEVIREAMQAIVAARADDANLHYLDGTDLFGSADAERLPLPDGLHPGTEAHRLIGERFAEAALRPGGALR
jgi:hypothetical protein